MVPRLLLVVAVALVPTIAAAQSPRDRMTAHTFAAASGATLPYRVFVPAAAGPEHRVPLVLFLHGAGERGTDNAAQLRHGVGDFVTEAAQAARPCLVVAPQCPRGRWWDVDLLQEFAASLAMRPDVDVDRVYLTGLSMGGFATWHLAGRRPELFAAAVPVCGGGELDAAVRLATLPIWAFHGDADATVPVARSREMVAAVRKAGGVLDYTEYEGVTHDSWTRTYADPKVHEWLFAQRRVPPIVLHDGDRVVFFGDSITAAAVKAGGYIDCVASDLRARLPGVELIGKGVSGNRVPDLAARLERDVLAVEPTVVVVYIGINDVWHSLRGKGTPIDAFESGLRQLVHDIAAAGARVVLCTPSVIGEKAAGSNQLDGMLDEYAAVSRRVAASAHLTLLDLRARFVAALRARNTDDAERGVLTTDGVHLNAAGNRFVADAMLEVLGAVPAPEPAAAEAGAEAPAKTDKKE
ncbi:MAG: GDSL-type esterase/lipase family protein [Planctomycetota bacterium]